MEIKRTVIENTQSFKVGDIISFTQKGGEFVEAMAVKSEKDGMVFLFVDCFMDEECMNEENSNRGGYIASDLRAKLNGAILEEFPDAIRELMVPFANGDFLRLPTEKEIFGENIYGEKEDDSVKQFEPMKLRRNRIAFQGHNGGWEWYWLQNKARGSATLFAGVGSAGAASGGYASGAGGGRPAFKIKNLESEPLVGEELDS